MTINETLERLNKVTANCREDMHEPDNQGISAKVTGWQLDNAMGDNPYHNCGEYTVGITQEDENGNSFTEWFNLADIIALARKAQL